MRDAKGRFVKAAFKAGDAVRCVNGENIPPGTIGMIQSPGFRANTWNTVWVDNKSGIRATWSKEDQIVALVPAKADDAKDQEIERLKAEVEEAQRIANEAVDMNHKQAKRFAACEAKLSDAAAILRVMELAKASENPDWDFTTLIAQVLGDAA